MKILFIVLLCLVIAIGIFLIFQSVSDKPLKYEPKKEDKPIVEETAQIKQVQEMQGITFNAVI